MRARVLLPGRLSLAALVLLLLSTSCAGTDASKLGRTAGTPQSAPNPAALSVDAGALPAPSALLRSTAAVNEQRAIAAITFSDSANVVQTLDERLLFLPDFPQDGSGEFSGLAWAVYRLGLTGYSDDITLELLWEEAPENREDIYVAFADFTRDRWQWFQPDQSGTVPTGENSRFILGEPDPNAGRALVVVAVAGTDNPKLTWLRVGGNAPPLISIDPPVAYVQEDNFMAFAASVYDVEDFTSGASWTYYWDLDGDETPDFPNTEVVTKDLHDPAPLAEIQLLTAHGARRGQRGRRSAALDGADDLSVRRLSAQAAA